jgi:hypothetical protein
MLHKFRRHRLLASAFALSSLASLAFLCLFLRRDLLGST